MQKLFVSYARTNRPEVDQLVEHLSIMGYETWVDVSLRGGQDWWEEILDRITNSDVFITAVSEASLKSTACGRELDWAESLGKPVLPVLIEALPATALPRRISRRQIIDYSQPAERDRAALRLQGGLGTLDRGPALPEPLPEPPDPPLSYLTDLVDLVSKPTAISHDDQHQIVIQLEQGLNAYDPEERRGASDILDRLSKRPDLYADVDRTITRLRKLGPQPPPPVTEEDTTTPSDEVSAETAPSTSEPPPTRRRTESIVDTPASDRTRAFAQPGERPSTQPTLMSSSYRDGQKAPLSPGNRMTAALIDAIPVLAIFGVAVLIAVLTGDEWCYYSCETHLAVIGAVALIVAAFTALGYMAWNWLYRQSRTGATVGQAALKIKMLDGAGQPPGFRSTRIARLGVFVFATALLGLLASIQLTGWAIGGDSNIFSVVSTDIAPW